MTKTVILAGKKAYKLNAKWRGDIVETSIFADDKECKTIAIAYGYTLEQMRSRQRAIAELIRGAN